MQSPASSHSWKSTAIFCPQLSIAVSTGALGSASPHSITTFSTVPENIGGSLSIMEIIWVEVTMVPQPSFAVHVLVIA